MNETENMSPETNQEEIETKKILFWNVKVETLKKIKKIAIRGAEGVAVAVVMAAGAIVVLAAKAKSYESETPASSEENNPSYGSCDSENVTEDGSEESEKE